MLVRSKFLVAALSLFLLSLPVDGRAEVLIRMKPLWGKIYRPGQWYPVSVSIEACRVAMRAELQVSLTNFHHRTEIALAPGQGWQRVFYFLCFGARPLLSATLQGHDGLLRRIQRQLRLQVLDSTMRLAGCYGHQIAPPPAIPGIHWVPLPCLPDQAEALEAMDILLLGRTDLCKAEAQALREWILAGGILILTDPGLRQDAAGYCQENLGLTMDRTRTKIPEFGPVLYWSRGQGAILAWSRPSQLDQAGVATLVRNAQQQLQRALAVRLGDQTQPNTSWSNIPCWLKDQDQPAVAWSQRKRWQGCWAILVYTLLAALWCQLVYRYGWRHGRWPLYIGVFGASLSLPLWLQQSPPLSATVWEITPLIPSHELQQIFVSQRFCQLQALRSSYLELNWGPRLPKPLCDSDGITVSLSRDDPPNWHLELYLQRGQSLLCCQSILRTAGQQSTPVFDPPRLTCINPSGFDWQAVLYLDRQGFLPVGDIAFGSYAVLPNLNQERTVIMPDLLPLSWHAPALRHLLRILCQHSTSSQAWLVGHWTVPRPPFPVADSHYTHIFYLPIAKN